MRITTDRVLSLDDLNESLVGIAKSALETRHDALLLRFEGLGQHSGVGYDLKKDEVKISSFQIDWSRELTDRSRRTLRFPTRVTEYAAEGLAFLLLLAYTEYTAIEQSVDDDGIDYWLGYQNDVSNLVFERSARVEISGMYRRQPASKVRERIAEKLSQTDSSDYTGLPAYIVVTDFSRKDAHWVEKCAAI